MSFRAPGVALRREWVWRWALTHPGPTFTLAEAASALGRSPRVVRTALSGLLRAGALAEEDSTFHIVQRHVGRIAWATYHRPKVLGALALRLPTAEIESLMVPAATFTGSSAVRLRLEHTPADASEVWVYAAADRWAAIARRFDSFRWPVARRHLVNLRVWEPDPWLPLHPLPWDQVWVDLWQCPAWWSVPYLQTVEAQLAT